MSYPNNKLSKLKCFESLKVDYSDNEEPDLIHNIIKEDKNVLLNFFAKQPYFKELMPKIKKASRGTIYYKGLIKKGLQQQSDFFKIIMKSIKKIKEQNGKKPKNKPKIRLYKLPKLKELKLRKQKIEDINVKKIELLQLEKEKFNKYKEQIQRHIPNTTISSYNTKKITKLFPSPNNNISFNNNDFNKINCTNNSFYKNKNFGGTKFSQYSMMTPFNDISTYYQSNNFKKLSRNESFLNKMKSSSNNINSLNSIITKCIEEITSGKEVNGDVSNYNKDLSKTIESKLKVHTRNSIKRDKNVIEDQKNKKNKYIKLEENNYANIKRKLNQKISYSLAYRNRKELIELLKSNKNAESYILHLNEMNKINRVMEGRRIIERETIHKVKSLCNIGYQKNEFVNKEIDKINSKNKGLNKLDKSLEYVPNDDFLDLKRQSNLLKGSLLPKLLSLRDESYRKINVGNSLNKIN